MTQDPRYVRPPALLAVIEESRRFGFLGPGDLGPQLDHAEGFARAAGVVPGAFLDLGSGGGLPGLVLALCWPAARGVLLDAMVRRTDFLQLAVEQLGLADRIAVVCSRAEDAARTDLRGRFEVVTARSFGPPAVTAECAAGFLADGGILVVSEPPEGGADRWNPDGLALLGFDPAEPLSGEPRFVRMARRGASADRWPRRVGVPAKRPLWG